MQFSVCVCVCVCAKDENYDRHKNLSTERPVVKSHVILVVMINVYGGRVKLKKPSFSITSCPVSIQVCVAMTMYSIMALLTSTCMR